MRRAVARTAVLILVVVLGAVRPDGAGAEPAGVAYVTRISGVDDAKVKAVVDNASRLIALQQDPAPSLSALRRRAQDDLDSFSTVLRAEGYYDHALRYVLDTSKTPLRVRVYVAMGPPYRFESFDVLLEASDLEVATAAVDRARAKIELGKRARSAEIVASEATVVAELKNASFPFARMEDREVVVDHAEQTVAVRTRIVTGDRARFGEVRISGVNEALEQYVLRRVPWEPGTLYDARLLEKLRAKLAATGVFSRVAVRSGEEVEADGTLPILIQLTLGKPRSIGARVGYSSSEGAIGSIYWEHRNLLGRAERLRIAGEVSELGEEARIVFRRPDFLSVDQALVLDSSYEIENTEAFDTRKYKASAGIERPLARHWSLLAGVAFEVGPVEDAAGNEDDFLLVGLPATLRRDTTEDLLDPTQGTRLELGVTPYIEELGSELTFVFARLSQSAYVSFDRERRFVFAGRAAVGSLSGAGREQIPADKRFYAGGGGSIRGFEFQLAGPLDADDDPVGGRSLVEVGGEVRVRLTERLGLVPFVDGGNVFFDSYPSFDEDLFWGAGLGLRYFSAVGPIRVDVATPLNPRGDIDDPVQFYISLGQAF